MTAKVTVLDISGIPSKLCPGCGLVLALTSFAQDRSKSDNRTSYCKACRRRQKLAYRMTPEGEAHERFYQACRAHNHPQKDAAKALIRELLRRKLITKPDVCDVCKAAGPVEGHHPDYTQPYEVYFLCKDCHAFVHSAAYKKFDTHKVEV